MATESPAPDPPPVARDAPVSHRDATDRGLRHLFRGEPAAREARYRVVAGAYPADLRGTVLTTVLAREAVFDRDVLLAAPHLLSCPGHLLSVDLEPVARAGAATTLRVGVRPIETPAMHLRALFPGAFARAGLVELGWLGVSNQGNTTPVPVFPDARGGVRLLAAYDAGRPLEIDPRTCALVGPVGRLEDYHAATGGTFGPLLGTTGHPVYDPEFAPGAPRLLFTNVVPRAAGFARPNRPIASDLYVMTWDGRGAPTAPLRVCERGAPVLLPHASAHQLLLTRRHLVVFNASLVVDTASMAGPLLEAAALALAARAPRLRAVLEGLARRARSRLPGALPEPRCDVFVLRKDDLRAALANGASRVEARRFVLPHEITHAVCDHDDEDDRITLFCQAHPGTDPADPIEAGERLLDGSRAGADFAGLFAHATDLNYVARHELDLRRGTVRSRTFPEPGDAAGFPLGVNLLPPTQVQPYRPRGQGPWDLLACTARQDATFWVSGGYLPAVASERLFARYRRARAGGGRVLPMDAYLARLRATEPTARLFALDRELAPLGAFAFPAGTFMATPVFAPRPGARGVRDGYLVGAVWSARAPGVELWVFDAARPLDRGPVCRLAADEGERALSPGFPLHAAWLEPGAVANWRAPDHRVPALELPAYVKLGESAAFLLGTAARWLTQRAAR